MEANIERPSRNINLELQEIRNIGPVVENAHNNFPLRNYASIRLRNAHFLKQFQHTLELYDCLEDNFDDRNKEIYTFYENQTLNAPRTIGFMSFGIVMAFIKFKGLSPFRFESYVTQVYNAPLVFALSYSVLRYLNVLSLRKAKYQLKKDYQINLAKSQLHSYSTKLFNELKYDISELI